MELLNREYPRLRTVEAIPDPENERIILRDPTQLAAGLLLVGVAEFALLTLLDGERRRVEIQAEYARRYGRRLRAGELDDLLEELDSAGFLDGEGFEAYYTGLVAEYRRAPYRPLRDRDDFGAPAALLPRYLDEIVEEAGGEPRAGRLAGIIAPHLDFPRGRPCYGAGYHPVRHHAPPRRVVVLGTNHYGRSESVVATRHDFQTPWGVLPTDRPFLDRLQAECGGDLTLYELDHLREHSIELHAVWLHHLLGDGVRIVPVLCPDPSGPRGTAAGDPHGVDLRDFALALRRLLREEDEPTLLVASADLSHTGRYFGDDGDLTGRFLQEIRRADEAALARIDTGDAEAFRAHMARTGNPTRVCSVGCIYALMVALGPGCRPYRLRYHQAVTAECENCVTSTAYAFYEE